MGYGLGSCLTSFVGLPPKSLEIGLGSSETFDDPLIVAGQKNTPPKKKSKLSWLSSGYAIVCVTIGSIIIMIFA